MTRVLLIEDNEMNRDMLRRRLERRGYEIIEAQDGDEGERLATEAMPDVILMDLSLPIIDGWQLAERLKADPKTARIPVIALTAHAMAGDRERAIEAGCDEFETKPVDLERLLDKIEHLTDPDGS
jgi:two-component system cell cycle response regulator DivK